MAAVTLRDVAERAGVSPRTVSNVVNGYVRVTEPLRARVLAAVEELGYRPNMVARSLKSGRTGLLALMIPEIDVPYFSELARGMIAAAEALGSRVMIGHTDGDAARERDQLIEATRASMFDGILLNPLALSADEVVELAGRMPVVLLGEHVYDGRFDHVAIDNVGAARDAVEHLVVLGRRRIAAIGDDYGEPGTGTAHLRTAGYLEALRRHGLEIRPERMVGTRRFHREDGRLAMRRLLELPERPDAVFCYSDLLALGAMKEIHGAGLRMPEDIAVIGMDDIEDGRYHTPALSTIAPDKGWIAEAAVSRLLERIKSPGLPPVEIVASHRLEVRGSSVVA